MLGLALTYMYRRVEGPSSCKPLKHNHRTWKVNSALMRLLQRQPLFYFCWSCWSTQKLPTITDPLEASFLFVLFLLHFLAHFFVLFWWGLTTIYKLQFWFSGWEIICCLATSSNAFEHLSSSCKYTLTYHPARLTHILINTHSFV